MKIFCSARSVQIKVLDNPKLSKSAKNDVYNFVCESCKWVTLNTLSAESNLIYNKSATVSNQYMGRTL